MTTWTGISLRGSYPINVLMADKLRKLVPSKEPVSLTNRTHAAGVHQKAMINSASTYEANPLDQFGVTESEILLGPIERLECHPLFPERNLRV